MKIVDPMRVMVVGDSATRTTPAATVSGEVTAWSQPRRRGLISSIAVWTVSVTWAGRWAEIWSPSFPPCSDLTIPQRYRDASRLLDRGSRSGRGQAGALPGVRGA